MKSDYTEFSIIIDMNEALKEKLKNLPMVPGVYFHKSVSGEIIYVGKAASLRNRVRQYFQSKRDMDVKTRALVEEIVDVDWVEVETEMDALFLESEMVKRYMPKWNILLRDDKSYTYIRIDMKEEVPYVGFTRNPLDDGAQYFGPYYESTSIKKAMRYLRRVFPYYEKPFVEGKIDLNYHLGLTPGLETGKITSKEYRESLKRLTRYIKGERAAILRELKKEMEMLSELQQFEKASIVRDQYLNLRALQKQVVFGDKEFVDLSKDRALSRLRTLLGLKEIPMRIEGYDVSHTGGRNVVSSMVVFKNGMASKADYRKFKIRIDANDDVKNMKETIRRRFAKKHENWSMPDLMIIDGGKGQLRAVLEVLTDLGLAGKVAVVGVAKREEELIVDIGRSGVSIEKLNELVKKPIEGVYVCEDEGYLVANLHVGQTHSSGHAQNLLGETKEHEFSDVVKLIQRIRDESHRFAVSYHTLLRGREQTKSALDDIPGIGPKTKALLKKKFGSVAKIRKMSEEELVEAVGKNRAKRIKDAL